MNQALELNVTELCFLQMRNSSKMKSEKARLMVDTKGVVGFVALRKDDHVATASGAALATYSSSAPLDWTLPTAELSVRAVNVLKELAVELTGEQPPKGDWVPSECLLHSLTFRHLSTARNCGPATKAEIIAWAGAKGYVIRRPFSAGKSLSAMWQDAIARFRTGELSITDVAEALEKSTRRRSTKIPLAFQLILIQLLDSLSE